MVYSPMTPEEAHFRAEEAEQGIANGEVVLHSIVIANTCELLEIAQVKFLLGGFQFADGL